MSSLQLKKFSNKYSKAKKFKNVTKINPTLLSFNLNFSFDNKYISSL